MKITLFGAAGDEVTGSAYLVQIQSARGLVYCGIFPGNQVESGAAARALRATTGTAHLPDARGRGFLTWVQAGLWHRPRRCHQAWRKLKAIRPG